jgi:hypothetical protein
VCLLQEMLAKVLRELGEMIGKPLVQRICRVTIESSRTSCANTASRPMSFFSLSSESQVSLNDVIDMHEGCVWALSFVVTVVVANTVHSGFRLLLCLLRGLGRPGPLATLQFS